MFKYNIHIYIYIHIGQIQNTKHYVHIHFHIRSILVVCVVYKNLKSLLMGYKTYFSLLLVIVGRIC